MKKKGKRLLALFLSVVLAVTGINTSSFAYEKQKEKSISVRDSKGNTITEDDSWEEKFPNGTFAFKNDSFVLKEGEKTNSRKITVYRLGGTKGKATAKIAIAPAVSSLDKDMKKLIYANAASNSDYTVKVENPISSDETMGLTKVKPSYDLEVENEEGKVKLSPKEVKGKYVRYYWQIKENDGWKKISGESNNVLSITESDYKNNTYACVVESDYELSLSKPSQGEADSETWVNLNSREITKPEKTTGDIKYSDVPLDTINNFKTTFCQVDFDEGEWVKDIVVEATDDSEHEADELSTFTIYDTVGATMTETANKFSLCISDDEEAIDSEMGFEKEDIRVDKSKGKAVITVKRTGGTQYVSSVDYATEDGTAVAGVDYVKGNSSATFSGGFETYKLEVNLINDKKKSEEDKYFTIKLKNPKAGTIKDGSDEIRVNLYNSDTSKEDNLATITNSKKEKDVSSRVKEKKKALTQTSNKVVVEADEKKETKVDCDPVIGSDDMSAQEISDGIGKISSSNVSKGSSMWSQTLDLDQMEAYRLKRGLPRETLSVGSHKDINTDVAETVYYDIDGLYNRFSKFDFTAKVKTHKLLYLFYNYESGVVAGFGDSSFGTLLDNYDSPSTTFGSFTKDSGDEAMDELITSQKSHCSSSMWLFNYRGSEAEKSDSKRIEVNKTISFPSNPDTNHHYFAMKVLQSWRDKEVRPRDGQILPSTMRLTRRYLDYASNSNPTVHILTADDKELNALTDGTLKGFRNTIKPSLSIPANEGGFSNNGMLFLGSKIKISPNASSQQYKLSDASLMVNNSKKLNGTKSGDDWTVSLSDNQSVLPTKATYDINLVYNRAQKININMNPSILDDDTPEKRISKVNSIKSNITIKNSTYSGNQFVENKNNNVSFNKSESDEFLYSLSAVTNFKSINFNCKDGTQILYNNKVYDGASDIPISDKDLFSSELTFQVYTPDSVSVERNPKIVSQDNVMLYEDTDDNGKYSSSDKLIEIVGDNSTNIEKFERHNGHQVLIKVDCTIQPACLQVPVGKSSSATFNLVPSFTTALTDEAQKAELSKEMQGYRDIGAKDGKAKMYGAEASSATVSFASGYDASPAKYNESTKKYAWTPTFVGNLKTPFVNPEQIVLNETKMADHFIAASTTDQINAYLGSIHGNDSYVLTARLDATKKITSTSMGKFYAVPEPATQAFSQDQVAAKAPKDETGTSDDKPAVADTSPDIKLPSINVGLGPLSYIMGEDEIGFSVGIPIFSKESGGDKADWFGKKALQEMKEAMTSQKKSAANHTDNNNIFKQLKDTAKKPGSNAQSGGAAGNSGNNASASPLDKKASVDVAANLSFMWKYSKVTGKFEFSSAMVAVAASGSLKAQYRFPACPIFYVYVQVSLELEVSSGLEVEKKKDDQGNIHNEVKFHGVSVGVELFVEAGVGVGVDLAKLEVYVKVSVSFAFTIAGDNGTEVDSFETKAAVGFRAVFLFFSYEMDVIGCSVGYDKEYEKNYGWYFKWQVAGRDMGGESDENNSGIAGASVSISKPKNWSKKQRILTSDDNTAGDMDSLAFDVDGIDSFQVSGYGNATSAVELGKNFDPATDYQLVTVGDTNYVVYTISRAGATHPLNTTQIVLSKLSTTNSSGDKVLGLVNPIDENASERYIVIDQKDAKADPTGDLDYNVQVDGSTIRVTWTSYKESASTSIPSSTDTQDMLNKASKMVDVKMSTYDTAGATGFADATVLGSGSGYCYIPCETQDVTFYMESVPYTETQMVEREKDYKEYYEEKAEGNTADGEGGNGDPYAQANYEYALTTDHLYGKYSVIHYNIKQSDGSLQTFDITPTKEWMDQETRMESFQAASEGTDKILMSYVTEQKKKIDGDYVKVKKLLVQQASVVKDGETKKLSLQTPKVLKTLVDYEDSNDKDGEYEESELTKQFDSPSFSNLKYLRGKLTPNGKSENFLIFTMNGCTYVMDHENLETAVTPSSSDSIMITPLFEVDEKGNTQSDATIGVDGDGNISAVYADTVPNTVNNALYVTKYDPNLKKFGEGFMLAMNHMQVYEDSQANLWTEDETKSAYYDESKGGGMNKFVFASPQIALGTPTVGKTDGTLTILTKGTFNKLVKTTLQDKDGEDYTEYIPDTSTGGMGGTSGFYAITYGIGNQKLGEESIHFKENTFVKGSTLTGSVSFRNTGDVAIRGSESNPASVKLMAAKKEDPSDTCELCSWSIKSNVLAGQEAVMPDTQTQPLPDDISERVIYFTVSEDADYIGSNAFSASTFDNDEGNGKIVVGNKAEVSIDDLQFIDNQEMAVEEVNGEKCIITDVDMKMSNNGLVDASNIKLKVEKSDGKSEETGEDKYVPLEYSGTLMYFDDGNGNETPLTGTGNKGEYALSGYVENQSAVASDGTLAKGKSIELKGKIRIPVSCFDQADATKSINLKVTALTDSDEYESSNNSFFQSFAPRTQFKLPAAIALTRGNSISFDVGVVAACSQKSNITMTEMTVSENGEATETTNHILNSLSYNPTKKKATVMAAKEGSGIIRIADTTTGSYKDISFVATMSGCNVSTENPMFVFNNFTGGTKWEDKGVGKITEEGVLPYNNDICIGGKGNTFTFETYAENIDFYFDGKIKVTSVNSFGFDGKEVDSSKGTDEKAYTTKSNVDFGNTGLKKHTVTVEVLSETASFDRIVERYSKDSDEAKEYVEDENAPKIMLGKGLPDANKLQAGTVFEMPVFMYDDVCLNSISVNGVGADEQVNSNFAKATFKITKNGLYKIIVVDSSGNISKKEISVDWFDSAAQTSSEVVDNWPKVNLSLVDEKDQAIPGFTNGNAYIKYQVEAERKVSSIRVYSIDMSTFTTNDYGNSITVPSDSEEVTGKCETNLSTNGYYMVKVEDNAGHVCSEIICVSQLSKGPDLKLYVKQGEAGKLFYCVGSEENDIPLAEMAVYEGNVTLDNSAEISVDGKTPLFKKDYTTQTMDSGTIDINDSESSSFTIFAKDSSGKIKSYVYDDKTCLKSLVVRNEGVDMDLSTDFSPYQREYQVELPFGYPEGQLPDIISKGDDDADVQKIVDGDLVTLRVTKGDVVNDYTIQFVRAVCTCGMELSAYDKNVYIGKDNPNPKLPINVNLNMTYCNLKEHASHKEENVKYNYEVLQGEEYASVESGEVSMKRIPDTETPQVVVVKVTASTDTSKATKNVTYTLYNKYDLSISTTSGGKVILDDNELSASEEQDSNQSNINLAMNTGDDISLSAKPEEGYEFTGWYDKDNKMLSKEEQLVYKVSKDDNVRANFKDVVQPSLDITMTDKSGTNNIKDVDGKDVLVSKDGVQVALTASDDQSGIKSVSYQVVKKGEVLNENANWIPYNEPFDLEDEMDFEIYAKAVDVDGNEKIVCSKRAIIDRTALQIHLAPNFTEGVFTNKKDAKIDVEVLPGTTEIKKITYQVGETVKESSDKTFTIDSLPDGEYDVKVKTVDILDHETESTMKVRIDTQEPKLTVTGNPEEEVERAVLAIEADGGISGVKEIKVNGTVITSNEYEVTENGTYTFTLENQAGSTVQTQVIVSKIAAPKPSETPGSSAKPTVEPSSKPSASTLPSAPPTSLQPSQNNATPQTSPTVAAPLSLMLSPSMKVEQGTTSKIKYLAEPVADKDGLRYTTSNSEVADVDAAGNIIAKKSGKAQIEVCYVSNPSIKAKFTVTVTIPKTKTTQIKNHGKKGAVIVWKGVKEAVAYKVYKVTKKTGKTKLVAKVKTSSYVIKKRSKKYDYKIMSVASNQEYNSELSLGAAPRVQKLTGIPNATAGQTEVVAWAKSVKNLKAKAKKNKVMISWKTVKGANCYVVYRAESKYGIFSEFMTVQKSSLRDTYVQKGRKYYYKVRAFKNISASKQAYSKITKKVQIKAK